MALARVQYTADGSTDTFSVTFPYLKKGDVKAAINGVPVTGFTWPTNGSIKLASIPASGSIIDIVRETERENILVDFKDGSTLLESDLDLSARQSFYLAQESFDQTGSTLAVANDGSYSANTRRISSVGYPELAGDAATKQHVADIFAQGEDAFEQAQLAAGSEAKAEEWAELPVDQEVELGQFSALHHAAKSSESSTLAISAKDAAEQAEVTALGYRDTAKQHRDAAALSATNANQSETAAQASEDSAEAYAASINPDQLVSQTSVEGAAQLPVGTIAQRPPGANGLLRYNSEDNQFEGYQDGEWGAIGGGGSSHVLSVSWEASRDLIFEGLAAADGQELSRATYPDAWAQIEALAATSLVTDDATWLADPAQRGKFSTGDGSTTFRVPDYNGKSAGAIGGVYLTGDGLKTAAENGLIRDDQMQRITGSVMNAWTVPDDPTGAFKEGVAGQSARSTPSNNDTAYLDFDSALSPDARTGTYTHGVDVSGCWVIRLFGAVVNVGSADAAQLATDYANLAGEVANKLDANDALGGTAQSWQDVTASRSAGVTYTNSTGRPIFVSVSLSVEGPADYFIDGVALFRGNATAANANSCTSFVVPDGSTYETNVGFFKWAELR